MIPLLLAAGCGGNNSGSGDKTVSVTITPVDASVIAGQSITLTVTPKNTDVVWPTTTAVSGKYSLNGNTVTYTPPASPVPHTYDFKVTAEANSLKTAVAKVTVRSSGSALDLDLDPVRQSNPAAVPIQGSPDARIVMVDFTDYQCPYCGQYARDIYPELKKLYVDTGKIRYVVLDLPLASHFYAKQAAEASHCAADQGKFWEMHDQMMKDELASRNELASYAKTLKLDIAQFEGCLGAEAKYTEAVNQAASRNLALTKSMGLGSVPSFAIGITDPATPQKVQILWTTEGVGSVDAFKLKLDASLAVVP
jgi:protein-disulfide isomerase